MLPEEARWDSMVAVSRSHCASAVADKKWTATGRFWLWMSSSLSPTGAATLALSTSKALPVVGLVGHQKLQVLDPPPTCFAIFLQLVNTCLQKFSKIRKSFRF